MSDLTLSSKPTRDTGWKRHRREKGLHSRYDGSRWGYYAAGTIHAAPTREAAIEGRDEARKRKRQTPGVKLLQNVTSAARAAATRATQRGRWRRRSSRHDGGVKCGSSYRTRGRCAAQCDIWSLTRTRS